ncbi:MAG: FkbM family methyltransferase [Bacteroidia bacterium]
MSISKLLKYTGESLGNGNVKLFFDCVNYFAFKKVPQRHMHINNPKMGVFEARPDTTDFMYSFYAYEYKLKDAIKARLKDFDHFVDIGGCVGDYCIWLGNNSSDIKIHAFEPAPSNFNQFNKHIEINGLNNRINLYKNGVGSEPGSITFKIHPENKGYTSKYLDHAEAEEIKVDVVTFDNFIESKELSLNDSYIIKIDVEGMELEVLKGATHFLQNVKKAFVIFEAWEWAGKNEIIEGFKEIVDFELIQLDRLNCAAVIEN